jgi:hypothetical protein
MITLCFKEKYFKIYVLKVIILLTNNRDFNYKRYTQCHRFILFLDL